MRLKVVRENIRPRDNLLNLKSLGFKTRLNHRVTLGTKIVKKKKQKKILRKYVLTKKICWFDVAGKVIELQHLFTSRVNSSIFF